MKNLLMTKSSDCKSDLVKGHASRPYKNTSKYLLLINWRVTSAEATRPIDITMFVVSRRQILESWVWRNTPNECVKRDTLLPCQKQKFVQ